MNKEDYFDIGQFISPVIEHELWITWPNTDDALALGIQPNDTSDIVLDGHHFLRIPGAYTAIKTQVVEEFNTGRFALTNSILALSEKLSNECIEMAHGLGSDISQVEFEAAMKLMKRLRFPWMASLPIGDAGEEFMAGYADAHKLTIGEVIAKIPDLPISIFEDRIKLADFKDRIGTLGADFDIEAIQSKNPRLAGEIAAYQKRTEYFGTHNFWGESRTLPKLLSAIRDVSTESQRANHQVDEEVFRVIAGAVKWRLECAEAGSMLSYALRPFLTAKAEKAGMKFDDIIFLTHSEIEMLEDNGESYLPSIHERQISFGIYGSRNSTEIIVGEVLQDRMREFGLVGDYSHLQSLKGTTGNKGKVTGIVGIVREPKDVSKIQKGMVLVAPATTPDFMPAMSIAAAFVTDTGGITAHAAIIAREMGKPCVIGTKIATQVFKNGDIVEVDADNGVVRKI